MSDHMTKAFTYAQAHGPDMLDAIGSPSQRFPLQPDEAPAVSKDSTDPHCTPPSSPSKPPRPSTPKSTPLHRRFLKEVSMSPASPATPATPPRTPSRTQRDTPTRDRDPPTKVRPPPTKNRGSPAKLEIGQNGFYFSCEIPMSKITPKKQASPQKSSRAGTPTRRTPSPLKNETPVKRNPGKAVFGTPAGNATGATQIRARSPVMKSVEDGSLAWAAGKMHRGEARDLMAAPVAPLRIPPDCLTEAIKQDVGAVIEASRPSSAHSAKSPAKDSRPENIGHMMARLTSGTFKTYDWAHAHQAVDPIKSPAPTPLRKASQKLNSVAPPAFLKLEAEESAVAVDEPRKNTGGMSARQTQEPHPLGGKYFDESKRVKSPAIKCGGTMAAPKLNPAGPKVRNKKAPPFQCATAIDEMAMTQSSPYTNLLFPCPVPDPHSETTRNTPHRAEKHVEWQVHIFSPSKSRHHPMNQHRRAGTDPEVYLAMRKDMASMGESLRRSIGSVMSSSRLNTNELPPMSNAVLMRELEAEKQKIAPEPKARGRLTRWNSDTPAVCPPRSDTLIRGKQRAATLTGPGIPLWQQSRRPAQALCEKIIPTKDASGAAPSPAKAAVATSRSRPIRPALGKPSKAPATPVATRHRRPRTTERATTPARPLFGSPAKKHTPAASPAKEKHRPPATPRAASKPISHTPAARATPSSKPPISTRRPVPKTPHPTSTCNSIAAQPYDPSTDPRPYEEKFASAAVIAGRVTQWHSEDRETVTATSTKSPTKPPSKAPSSTPQTTAQTAVASTTKPSSTPPRSPTKLPIRTTSPLKPPAPSHAPRTARQPIPAHPPRLAPKTPLPASRTPLPLSPLPTIPTISSTPFNPRTPIRAPAPAPAPALQSRIAVLDRNAFRTPSKAIQGSLGRAIDEKIWEDGRRRIGGGGGL